MRISSQRRHGARPCAASARWPTSCLFTTAVSLIALTSIAPVPVNALNFTAVSASNIDLSSLGRIGIVGNFSGISLYEYEEQTQSSASNGSQGLMTRLPNGALTTILSTDASIMSMCSYVLEDGTDVGVVLGGNFTSIGSQAATALALFNPNTSEVTPLSGLAGQVSAVLCDQESNTVYIGGSFTTSDSTNAIAYVDGSGLTPLSFAGFNGPVTSITKAANGNIIFGGSFTGLGNSTVTYSESNEQVINLSTANITSTGSSTTTGFSDPANIVCQTSGEDGSGVTWLLENNTAGYWQADFGFGFKPSKLRLYNTHQDGRGTETFRFTALPINGIMNLTYIDPDTGVNATCTSECPLSQDTNVTYQDFYFINNVGMNSFRLDISAWYGSGGGLNGIELFENDIFAYAIDSFNEPNCTASSTTKVSVSSATGPWTESPSYDSYSMYLTANLTSPISSSSASVVFSPDIRQSGNYSVNLYTPGCIQDGTCDYRGQVNITVTVVGGDEPTSVQLYQTNNYDKYDQVYFGVVDASSDSFRPTVTLTPLDGQDLSEMVVVAQRVGFTLTNSTGGLNGLYEFDPSDASSTTDLSSSTFDMLGADFSSDSAVAALATGGNVTYIAGNFTSSNASNIVAIDSEGSSVRILDDSLNGAVACIILNGTSLYVGGKFTATESGSVTDLNNIAVYDTANNVWNAIGGGVDGSVTQVVAMTMNITGTTPEIVIAFTGGFRELYSFGSNGAVSVDGFSVWVPSQNNWLQNLDFVVESIDGVLLSSLLDVPGVGALYSGALSYAAVGANDAVSFSSSGIGSLDVDIYPSSTTSASASATASSTVSKRDTVVGTTLSGVVTGLFDTSNSRNMTILAGHFSANSTSGETIENLMIIDYQNNEVTGLGSNISDSSTFVALAISGDTLYAGGNVTGTVNSASVSGLISYNIASETFNSQPPELSGGNGTVTAIKVRPDSSDVYVGGTFTSAGSLGCPAVCYYSSGQWNRPGTTLSGSVNTMTWISSSTLIAGGDMGVSGNSSVYLAKYSTSSLTWETYSGASAIPGPVDVLTVGSSDGSQLWVAGTSSSNGSLYLMKYDGSNWIDAMGASGQTLSSGTDIRSLQVFSVTDKHDSTDVLSASQVLVLTGVIILPGNGTVSAAVFDGTTFEPYLLTTGSGDEEGSIASIFVENEDFFTTTTTKHLSLAAVVLIGLAISLGLMLIIVAAGLLLDRLRKKRQGYVPAPAAFTRGAEMTRIPPQELLESLGRPQHEAPRV